MMLCHILPSLHFPKHTNAILLQSNMANKLDPTVDSDLSGRGNHHGPGTGGFVSGSHATPGSGTAQNTAGPHNSDLANRLGKLSHLVDPPLNIET